MLKLIAMGLTSVLSLGMAGLFQDPPPPPGGGPPPPKAKGKKGAPGDELRKTYDLLRRIRSDTGSGRTEERISDWTERGDNLYRRAIRTREQGDPRRAREIGTAAHDLARAVNHARNAARLDRPDPDLPLPPDDAGPEDIGERTRRDLNRAYERIRAAASYGPADSKFYLDAARDLYNAARRDVEAGRDERGGELARAAEAMTHVPEHLSNAGGAETSGPRGPDAKKKGEPRGLFDPPPDPKKDQFGPRQRRCHRRCPDITPTRIAPLRMPTLETGRAMDMRNRIGLYGSYFLGMAAIGFTLPYLPLYLGEKGLSDQAIGIVSTLAAISGLAQFPVGLWSDRIGWRKPFLVAALAVTALSTVLIRGAQGTIWLGLLVILFAENGIGRAVVESLSGAEAAALAARGGVGAALGALRFWKPIGIVLVALMGSWMSERYGVGAILVPLAVLQGLAVVFSLLIHERPQRSSDLNDHATGHRDVQDQCLGRTPANNWIPKDGGLWIFVAAMVLYHAANAPGGVYLGLFLKRDLDAPDRLLAYAFAVSMVAWMLVVWPAGWLADRFGRKPLLIAGWAIMTVRLGLVSVVQSPALAVANQALDGLGNGLFAVLAAAWVTDRLADPRRSGEAQVIVGSCLVLGSALGPAVAGFLVGPLGYRGLFAALAGVGAIATAIVVFFVPETLARQEEHIAGRSTDAMATVSDLSTVP